MKILLIHGLGRTSGSMSGLASVLQGVGHKSELFGYVSLLEPFDEIVGRLRDRFQVLATEGAYGVVTHSLGGVLTRAALAKADFPLPVHVVMLAPPNQSPRLGRWANQLFPYQWFSKQCGANMADPNFYTCLPPLDCDYTIIAGTAGMQGPISPFKDEANDMIVSLSETKMRASDRPIEVSAFHSFIMHHPQVRNQVVSAFNDS